jgi:hypothetical protein
MNGLRIRGCHVQWSKLGSERQKPHIFSHIWEIDTIQMQAILWKTSYAKGRPLTGEEGWKKEVKKVNIVDELSVQEWI